ncbi:MAG: HAD family phosphatase [Tissierellia bacterium]|nr:HAD family phosphatase [Tissierellia bacterium]
MKGILFDLDGTLIDSMPVWQNLDKLYVESKGFEYDNKYTDDLKAVSLKEAPEYFNKIYGMKSTFEDMLEFMEGTLKIHYAEIFEFKKGVLEKLKELKEKKFKMCITTATDSSLAMLAFNRLGLDDFMEFILTPDIAGVEKNDKEFFAKAARKLGIENSKLFVFDDALYALENAEKLGMIPVAVEDETSLNERENIKKISDIYLESFEDLDIDELMK